MKPILLILSLLLVCLAAEDAPRALNPTKPADAVQIVHVLTEKLVLPRDQAVALTQAIETLAKLAQEQPAPPAGAPAPVEAPKAKP